MYNNIMTENEVLSYYAGLIDGEAYVGAVSHKPYKRAINTYYVPIVELEMTSETTVKGFAEFFGLAWGKRKTSRGPKRRDTYWTHAASLKAVAVLERVIPFLKNKLEAANLAVSMQAHITKHKGGLHSKAVLQERKRIYEKLRAVNKRGR
jgi:hypothetical protein